MDIGPRELAILTDVARIATLDLELRPMMQRITDSLAERFGWEFVALVMVDPERTVFVCEAVTTSIQTEVHPGYSRPVGSGVVGEVASKCLPILVNDVRSYPNYVATAEGVRSELCVPVMYGEALVAILNLESTKDAAFNDQLPLLTTIANQIAGAIASARLIEELRNRARLMEMMSRLSRTALEATRLDELLDRVVGFISSQVAADVVAVLMYDAVSDTYSQKAATGSSDHSGHARSASAGVVGRCIRQRAPQLVLDVAADPDYIAVRREVVAELCVPIVFRESVLGVLNIESSSGELFTPAFVVAVQSFADQMAGAIHLASVKEELDQKGAALEAVNAELAQAIESLQRLSTTDALTGVANRRRFDEVIEVECRRASRAGSPLSLLMIDIDAFKPFNDRYGHPAGDACLRRVAEALHQHVQRASDLVARYGGEEFAVLLPGVSPGDARLVAETLRRAVAELAIPHDASPVTSLVTISIGLASSTRGEPAPDVLVRTADAALYEAKRGGRNRIAEA